MAAKEISAVVVDDRKMEVQEFDLPEIGPEDALLKLEMTGVCGSDIGLYNGRFKAMGLQFPLILGHEILGRIAQIGQTAQEAYKVKEGDRVIVEAFVPCGRCHLCLTGNYRICEKGVSYGSRVPCSRPPYLWGGYGQYMYITPGSVVHQIPERISAEEAVLAASALGNGIRFVRELGGVTIGDTVVIQGAGQMGLVSTIAARESGAANIIMTGLTRDHERFELGKEFGATHTVDAEKEDVAAFVRELTGGRMADVVVDTTGAPPAVALSIQLVRKLGTVVSAGLSGFKPIPNFISDIIVMNEIRFQGAISCDFRAVIPAIKLVESGKYPLKKMVTHRYPLRQAELGVRALAGEI
ncbi:MAG: alcohol dehydrogenase catalytic domain-containing protein, partial [Candidatus Tectomicrobia bacterium]|nr:alcohol dehydrogenase catalytic domain-containing protein [Candidatus Tectomicrobia bacterium]